jgi:hypothetical protein
MSTTRSRRPRSSCSRSGARQGAADRSCNPAACCAAGNVGVAGWRHPESATRTRRDDLRSEHAGTFLLAIGCARQRSLCRKRPRHVRRHRCRHVRPITARRVSMVILTNKDRAPSVWRSRSCVLRRRSPLVSNAIPAGGHLRQNPRGSHPDAWPSDIGSEGMVVLTLDHRSANETASRSSHSTVAGRRVGIAALTCARFG